jgi:hypothetical protein
LKLLEKFGLEGDRMQMTQEVSAIKLMEVQRDRVIDHQTKVGANSLPRKNRARGEVDGDVARISSVKFKPLLIAATSRRMRAMSPL